MNGVYTVEDLLKLRASPLIHRPSNLPPIEEWMGTQETTNKRQTVRPKQDEFPAAQTEIFQKRSTLLDSQRRTTTDPERIVLGPPRRSFASANNRTLGRFQDGLEETSHKDRPTLQEKSRNGDGPDSFSNERRVGQSNGRFNNRQESEEVDHDNRRDYDRKPKWAGRDRNEPDTEDEPNQDDLARPGPRKDTQSRAKLSQSWFKKDGPEARDETRRDADKGQEWRRSERTREREWDRSARIEAEPEWMDSAQPEEPSQVRTQEDFQRWKERMKAGGAAPQGKGDTTVISPAETAQAKSEKTVFTPEPDDSMDKFFARFESKTIEQKPGPAKPHGKTRFASFFSPPPDQVKQVEPAPSLPPMPPMPSMERPSSASQPGSAVDADQAGFARILEMLQTRSNNPTPQTQDNPKPKAPLYARRAESRTESESRPSPQNLLSILAGQNTQRQEPAQPEASASRERPVEPQPATEQPSHTRQQSGINKDEVLLNLLRQANLAPKPQPPPPHQHNEGRVGVAMYGMSSEITTRIGTARGPMASPVQPQDPMNQRREPGRGMFEESPVGMYHNESAQREQLPGQPANPTQPGFPEDPLMAFLRSQNPPQRPIQPPQPPQGPPPGLQRPPGLDQVARPNPNWPLGEQPPPPPMPFQQRAHRGPPHPPGLVNAGPRPIGGPPLLSQLQLPPQPTPPQPGQQPRAPQHQRKYTGDSSSVPAGLPGLPPGMYPPPGFMTAGPPPGFPGSVATHPAARYPGEPGPPPGMNRGVFMDMYGDVPGGRGVGLRGSNGSAAMPPYR